MASPIVTTLDYASREPGRKAGAENVSIVNNLALRPSHRIHAHPELDLQKKSQLPGCQSCHDLALQ